MPSFCRIFLNELICSQYIFNILLAAFLGILGYACNSALKEERNYTTKHFIILVMAVFFYLASVINGILFINALYSIFKNAKERFKIHQERWATRSPRLLEGSHSRPQLIVPNVSSLLRRGEGSPPRSSSHLPRTSRRQSPTFFLVPSPPVTRQSQRSHLSPAYRPVPPIIPHSDSLPNLPSSSVRDTTLPSPSDVIPVRRSPRFKDRNDPRPRRTRRHTAQDPDARLHM